MTREEIHIGDVVKYDDHPNYLYKITRKQPNGSFVLNCIKGSYHCIPYALADKMTLVKRQPEPKFNLDKSLEGAAKEYEWSNVDINQLNPPTLDMTVQVGALRDAFKAGAEWQARQLLQGSPMPEDTVLFNKGVEEGRRLEREDMLKDAAEVTVENWNPDPHPEVTIPLNSDKFIAGDKVKVIVLKDNEDESK